jgi:hypothetical protein
MVYDKEIEKTTGIFVFKNAIPDELCDSVIKMFEKSENKFIGKTTSSKGNCEEQDFKNTIELIIDGEYMNQLYAILNKCTDKISDKYFYLKQTPMLWSDLQMQKSEKGNGFFKPHVDAIYGRDLVRILAPIFYLNDVKEGGETSFPMHGIDIKPEKGTIVVFPATWNYWHEGKVPTSNDKYIITCFGQIDIRGFRA